MSPRRFLSIAALLGALAAPAGAPAAPMHTDFATVQKEAATVVLGVARYTPSGDLVLDVDKVVRGAAALGTMTVKQSPDGHVSLGASERVVAFLTAAGELRWVGRKIAGPTIEAGVLELSGFFDFNAHLVSPGMVTLRELTAMLGGAAVTQSFAVTLAFPDGHGAQKPSAKQLTLTYDPATRKGVAVGFAPACLDLGAVWGLEWGRVELVFNDTCPRGKAGSRSLRLEGKPTGVDAAGRITAELAPYGPVLTEPEFDAFVRDGTELDVVRVVELALADGTKWSWQVGKALVDPAGRSRAAGGSSSSYSTKGGVTSAELAWEYGDARVVLSSAASVGGTDYDLLQAVDGGAFTGCKLVRKGTPVPCTARQVAPMLVR